MTSTKGGARTHAGPKELLCPSAQPEWEGSVAIGVVAGTATEPRVKHWTDTLPVDDVRALAAPVTVTEVFRLAAPCLTGDCVHFEAGVCSLAERIVAVLPPVSDTLPVCPIRARCRWWAQEGRSACRRCPQVVTDNYNGSSEMYAAAYGTTPEKSQGTRSGPATAVKNSDRRLMTRPRSNEPQNAHLPKREA